ncbi:PH domain-containing protein [Parasphingorhabdus sp.]|uniref:PH domain-containing protein n=1 Tax=Parasphingorhabdus sp. TaxID=2709688 RepID=UPI003002DEA2
MSDPADTGAAEAPPFRRLHPLSIILKSVGALGQNLFAIVVLHFSLFDQNIFYTGLAALALIALVIGVTALIWSRFTYQVTGKEIRIKSGLVNRNSRSIPFDRIQDVSLEQKLVSRLLGLATVALETGSGGGEDGQLDALAIADADALRDTIRDYKAGQVAEAASAGDGAGDNTSDGETPALFAMDNRRVLIAGLFNFSFVLLAVLGALAQNFDFLLPDGFFDPRRWLDALPERQTIDGFSSLARIGGALGAIVALVAVGLASGIVRTFVRDYDFRLERVDRGQPGFRRRRGLFTLTDMVMPIHRVQAAILQTGPVRERYGWFHLKFSSLAADAGGETDHSAAPCATLAEIDPILADSGIDPPAAGQAFMAVDPAFWWRRALLVLLLLGALAAGGGLFFHRGLFALVLLALPVAALLWLGWRHHRYALTQRQLFVHSGWWRRRLVMLPRRKIQTVDVSQSPLDHPLGLATVTIGIAGGSAMRPLMIRDIDFAAAMDLREALVTLQDRA